MRESDTWLILDTETTGIRNPVYPVEIAVQRMTGWKPSGAPFRTLLNFDVPIEPVAEKMHGYSRQYLREHGLAPAKAFEQLFEYAGALPLVAYNLTYDWTRVLCPTLERMNANCSVRPGFCALNLTRHVVAGLANFKLKTVMKAFGLASKQNHHAVDDVEMVVRLFSDHLGPHLARCDVVGYHQVAACAAGSVAVAPLEAPAPAKGMRHQRSERLDEDAIFAVGELVGICRLILLDNRITPDEMNFLAKWLEHCPHSGVQPIASIFCLIQDILEDGIVTEQERTQLTAALEEVLRWRP